MSSADLRKRLYPRYATTHAGVTTGRGVPAVLQDVIRRLPRDPNSVILDIGCGPGQFVAALHDAGFRNASGIDVSEEQVALAADRGVEGVEKADLLEYLSEGRGSYDVIVALDVLEHFDKDEVLKVLDRVAASLREGGLLVARSINGASPFMGGYLFGDFTHATAFTVRSLEQLCANAGFQDVRAYPVNPLVRGIPSAARAALWQLCAGALKLSLVGETGRLRGHIVTQNLLFIATR